MMDALAAARTALPLASATFTKDSGQLYITGYSQGGYVAMATHCAMQAAGMKVTAAAPMSGPYALAAFVDAVFYGEVNGDATVSSTLLATAYQKTYGDIYANPVDVFEPQYASGIDSLLPSTTPRSQLYAEGKLPEYALFSSTPPDPAFAVDTPPTTPANLAEVFALGFGTGNLIQNSYRLSHRWRSVGGCRSVSHDPGGAVLLRRSQVVFRKSLVLAPKITWAARGKPERRFTTPFRDLPLDAAINPVIQARSATNT